jgi:hypothetical protein
MGKCHETFKFEEGIGREPMSSRVIGQKATTLTTQPIAGLSMILTVIVTNHVFLPFFHDLSLTSAYEVSYYLACFRHIIFHSL